MNFKSFILTYGPGSIGSVARILSRSYIAMRKSFNASHREALIMMVENRYPNGKAVIGSEVLPKTKEEIVDECQEDLKEIILYILTIENKGVRDVIDNGHRYFIDVLDVINEVTKKELSRVQLNL
jgi:CRISPR/Cas system-associated endonuclease Cas3-HD